MNLLSGNEAIARGAWEAGCHIGAAYPGTPSTETMESFAKLPGVYAEWCPNEKVALEVAVGASAAGARVLVTMKHVGVNVCADPLFTAAYTGVNGGLVILAADDPGMFSSQNEQDSRHYAEAAKLVAPPGTSDHQTGLAVDITDKYYSQMDASKMDQDFLAWLKDNCAEYGFILRYPSSKVSITGWDEPWHFRYVGKVAAEFIMDNNLCLEQFISLYE